MTSRRASVIFAACIGLFSALPDVVAQQASSFEQLQMLVKPDDVVIVNDFSGAETRGRIAALSPSALRLVVDGIARDLAPADVLEIRQRRSDSLANGATIGAIAGGVIGVLSAILVCSEEDNCAAWSVAVVGVYAALGTGVGVGFDALVVRQQTIYRAPVRASLGGVTVVPFFSRDRKGVSLSLSF